MYQELILQQELFKLLGVVKAAREYFIISQAKNEHMVQAVVAVFGEAATPVLVDQALAEHAKQIKHLQAPQIQVQAVAGLNIMLSAVQVVRA
jgi:hypothetical protein